MCELLRNNSLFVGQLYEDKSLALRAPVVGIPNLACECIMGWRSVTFHFQVTVTLTFDLVFLE